MDGTYLSCTSFDFFSLNTFQNIVPILVTSGFRCFCEPHSNVRSKVGLPIEGVQVDYLDTPGVGDMDVTPMKVLTLIEQEFLGLALAGPLFHLPSAWQLRQNPISSYLGWSLSLCSEQASFKIWPAKFFRARLMSDQINGTDAIDGVIVTTPVPDGRVKLGAQVVQLLVEHGFLGETQMHCGLFTDRETSRSGCCRMVSTDFDVFRCCLSFPN